MKSSPFRKYGFAELLVLLISLFIIAPFTEKGGVSQIFLLGVFFLAVINATYLISKSKRVLYRCLFLAVPTILFHILEALIVNKYIEIATILFSLAFISFIIVMMVSSLFVLKKVTYNIILSAIIVYILLGIAWAFMYAFIDIIQPHSFAVHFSNQHLDTIAGSSVYDYFYYSFVVLCTVGFGDVTPSSPLAKSFSILEAITAQIYLTVIIARLVGMHISKR
jgi:hypothetical protein